MSGSFAKNMSLRHPVLYVQGVQGRFIGLEEEFFEKSAQ